MWRFFIIFAVDIFGWVHRSWRSSLARLPFQLLSLWRSGNVWHFEFFGHLFWFITLGSIHIRFFNHFELPRCKRELHFTVGRPTVHHAQAVEEAILLDLLRENLRRILRCLLIAHRRWWRWVKSWIELPHIVYNALNFRSTYTLVSKNHTNTLNAYVNGKR